MSQSSSGRGMSGTQDVGDHTAQGQSGSLPCDGTTGVRELIGEHLGSAGQGLELVGSTYPAWRWADLDAALDGLDEDQTMRGVGPGVSSLAELLASSTEARRNDPDDYRPGRVEYRPGPVEYQLGRVDCQPGPVQRSAFPVGPDEVRFVGTNVLRLVRVEGAPVVVFAYDTCGEPGVRVEVLAADQAAARSVLARIDDAVWADSSLRGRVISFRSAASVPSSSSSPPSFSRRSPVIDFHERSGLIAADVVLPPGRLTRIESVVLGLSRNAAVVRAAGQHLPRVALLYGPPGSGKTHTVRYLLSQSPETTAFILPDTLLRSMRAADMHEGGPADLIRQVLATARQLAPSIVVLEDVGFRDAGHAAADADRPGLTQVLAALSELHDDEHSDVAVILTTSHVEALEPALARRPGLIDLSLEVFLPDVELREQLFARSARVLPVTSAGVRTAAEAAVATPGSFPRQAVRRAVLDALSVGAEVDDARFVSAVRALMAEREELRTATSHGAFGGRVLAIEEPVASEPVAAAGPELHGTSDHSDGPRAEGSVAEVRGAGLGGGLGFDGDDGLGEGDGLDGGDGLDREDLDVEVIDDLDDGLSGEDLLDLDLDDED